MISPASHTSQRVLLFLFALCICTFQLHSQNIIQKQIRKFNSSEGLSHNIVNDMLQDEMGYIWIATEDGLNWYDGYEFSIYRFDPNDSTSISGNYIKCIFYDSQNNLWISSRYGLNLYNPEKDHFRRFTLEGDQELDITDIAESVDGNLWVSNYVGGFLHFNPKTGSFRIYNTENQAMTSNFVMAIHEDQRGLIWVGTGDMGIQVFSHENQRLIPHVDMTKKLEKFNTHRIEVIFEDSNHNIWIGSREGLIMYHHTLDEFFLIRRSGDEFGISDDIILDIYQDHEGKLLIGTQEGGLEILSPDQLKANDPSTFRFSKIQPGPDDNNLSYRSIQAIFEDREKNLWLGTYGNGINLVPAIQPKFNLITQHQKQLGDINYNKVWGICEDSQGFLWIGTDGWGINKYDSNGELIRQYLPGENPSDLSDDAILCALNDSHGNLWFGTYAGGLNLYDRAKDGFIHFRAKPGVEGELQSNDIRCIHESTDGVLWLGTNGSGLARMDKNGSFTHITPQCNGVASYDIRAIAEDSSGRLWLGTYGSGLFSYHVESGVCKHFPHERNLLGGLKCNIIYTLLFDESSNALWIGGSQSGGLNRMDLSQDSIRLYDHRNGLDNNNIHGIEKDRKNRIWVSTNTGISYLDPVSETFINFNHLDGVQDKEFSNGSSILNGQGDIMFFGGSGGLNYFYPDRISVSEKVTPIVISRLQIYDQPVRVRSESNRKSPLVNTLIFTDKLELDHTQDVFSLGFSGLNYSNPEKIRYQYKLEDTDLEWNNLGKQRNVTFRNLKAGDYLFRVRASNEDGIWADNASELLILIKPPPWRSIWAYIIYFILLAGAISWLYYYNLNQAKIRHNLDLEKRLRKEEHNLHEERIRFFTNISHELRTPLMLLISPLEELMTRESTGTPLGRKFSSMYRSANNLLHLINTLMEFRKTEKGKMKLAFTYYNISEHLEENCIAFKALAAKKGVKVSFSAPEEKIMTWFDDEKLEMILNNLLSNAIKNTEPEKRIMVVVNTDPQPSESYPSGSVLIRVIDEGIGIPEEELDKIYDRFFQVSRSRKDYGTGIGLALTKRLVELHHGDISVSSKINSGTTFTVVLPLGKLHLRKEELADSTPVRETQRPDFLIESGESPASSVLMEKIASLSKDRQKILIVEDNGEIRDYLRNLLKDQFIIEEAADGLQGLELARSQRPSLVISDIMMPEMNGVDLCHVLKTEIQTSHIPVILITANITHQMYLNSLEGGADAYLTKPFKPDVLISRVYNLLRSRNKLKDYYVKKLHGEFLNDVETLSKDEEFLLQVNRIIQSNMGRRDFSISQLHDELGMSRTVFYHKIKSLTQMSPNDLIREMRLKRAADLLVENHLKVYEVMFQVGFSDEKHFRQLFKNQFGLTPSQYGGNGR